MVFFKLIDPTRDNLEKSRDILLNMRGKIEQLREMEVGIDITRSKRSFDLMLFTKFESLGDLDDYIRHPIHITAQKHLSPLVELSNTVDYEYETSEKH